MKRIINNKVYNTDSAKLRGRWDNGGEGFDHVTEALFQKKTGEMFLFCGGGANTRYAKRTNDSWGWGEQIIPLTYEKAKEWAEAHLEADEYELIFGAIREDGGTEQMNLTLSSACAETIRRGAAAAGLGLSEYITRLVMGGAANE